MVVLNVLYTVILIMVFLNLISYTSDLKMKFDASGDLQFRTAGSEGFIPVGSRAELELIGTASGAKYKLEADIDLMSLEWSPIQTFTGTMDGNRKTVSNLTMTAANSRGFFGTISNNAVIKNLGITGINIQVSPSGTTTSGSYAIGGIAGNCDNATITNCYSTGTTITVTATMTCMEGGLTAGYFCVGGIAGNVIGGSARIDGCFSGVPVSASTTGRAHVCGGGIAGLVGYGGSISDCYSTAAVSAQSTSNFNDSFVSTGGIGGINGSLVTKTYSTGAVSGAGNTYTFIGGITGNNDGTTSYSVAANLSVTGTGNSLSVNPIGSNSGTFTDNYALGTMTITSSGTGNAGTSKTLTELQTQSTYTGLGWDFGSIWKMPNGGGYPILQWQP